MAVGAAGVLLGVGPGAVAGRDVVVGVSTGVSVGAGDGIAVAVDVGVSVTAGSGVAVPMGGCALGILAVEGDAKTALGAAAIRQAARKPIPIAAMVRIQIFPDFKCILYSLWPLARRPEHSQYSHDEPHCQPKNGQRQHRNQDDAGS